MSNLFKQIWNDIDTNLYLYSDHNYRYGPPTRTEYRLIVENLSSRISWQVRIPPVLFWVNHHSITFHSGSWTWSSHSDESWGRHYLGIDVLGTHWQMLGQFRCKVKSILEMLLELYDNNWTPLPKNMRSQQAGFGDGNLKLAWKKLYQLESKRRKCSWSVAISIRRIIKSWAYAWNYTDATDGIESSDRTRYGHDRDHHTFSCLYLMKFKFEPINS